MANLRFSAVQEAGSRQPLYAEFPSNKVSDYFGTASFGLPQMQATLAPEVFKAKWDMKDLSIDVFSFAVTIWAIFEEVKPYCEIKTRRELLKRLSVRDYFLEPVSFHLRQS